MDKDLRTKMVCKAQLVGLTVVINDEKHVAVSISKIGKNFKGDDSIETSAKINQIVNEIFNDESGYKYNSEMKVMNKLNSKRKDDSNAVKECVVEMYRVECVSC